MESFEWVSAKGGGRVYSYIEYHKAWTKEWNAHVPYVVAVIELDEGVRLISGLVRKSGGDLPQVGDRVEVAFQERANGTRVPVFREWKQTFV
jgi:uncharacterized OB-fold protein